MLKALLTLPVRLFMFAINFVVACFLLVGCTPLGIVWMIFAFGCLVAPGEEAYRKRMRKKAHAQGRMYYNDRTKTWE